MATIMVSLFFAINSDVSSILLLFIVLSIFTISFVLHIKTKPVYFKELMKFIRQNQLYLAEYEQGKKYRTIICSTAITEHINDKQILITFEKTATNIDKELVQLADRLSTALNKRLVDIKNELQSVTYIFSKDLKNRIYVKEDDLEVSDTIPIDLDYSWDFNKCPSGLVTGPSGSGKSFFLRYLILMFTKLNIGGYIFCADPKHMDFVSLKYTIHSHASEKEDIRIMVGTVIRIMEQRSRDIASAGYRDYRDLDKKMRPILLVFDEFSSYVALLDSKEKKIFEGTIKNIILKGRAVGVFVIIGMQRADASILSGDIRDTLSLNVGLGSMSDEGYRMLFRMKPEVESVGTQQGYYQVLSTDMTMPRKFETPKFDSGFDLAMEIFRGCSLDDWGLGNPDFYQDELINEIIYDKPDEGYEYL